MGLNNFIVAERCFCVYNVLFPPAVRVVLISLVGSTGLEPVAPAL